MVVVVVDLCWVSELVVVAVALIDFDPQNSSLNQTEWMIVRVEMALLGTAGR